MDMNNNNINIIENMLHGGHIAAQIGRAFWCPYARLDAEEKGAGKHGKVWSDDFDSCMHVCPFHRCHCSHSFQCTPSRCSSQSFSRCSCCYATFVGHIVYIFYIGYVDYIRCFVYNGSVNYIGFADYISLTRESPHAVSVGLSVA